MRGLTMILALCAGAAPAQELLRPPGAPDLSLELYDIRIESELVRFRFDYEGPDQSFDTLEPVFPWLCETIAARVLMAGQLAQSRVVISLSPEAVSFGEAAPGVPQFFEAFTVTDYSCAWEYF